MEAERGTEGETERSQRIQRGRKDYSSPSSPEVAKEELWAMLWTGRKGQDRTSQVKSAEQTGAYSFNFSRMG